MAARASNREAGEREVFLVCREPEVRCSTSRKTRFTPALDIADEVAAVYAAQGGHCFLCGQERTESDLRAVTVQAPAAPKRRAS